MTDPRCIVPGESYLVTRRCAQRQFLLTPSALLNQIFLYTLAYCAQKHGIALHAFVAMSNHCHLTLTDVLGVLPDFVRDLNSFLTRAVNAMLGRRETIWSSDKPSYVTLEELDDIIAKCAYTLTNPVEAGLVRSHSHWPGAISKIGQIAGTAIKVKKPGFFFGKSFPETIDLHLVPPPASKLEGTSVEEFCADLRARVEEDQREIRERCNRQGKGFLSKKKILKQSPYDFPTGPDERSGFNPRVAAQDKGKRMEAIERNRAFIEAYRVALAEYRDGNHYVVFPRGTWKMRVELDVRCEPFGLFNESS